MAQNITAMKEKQARWAALDEARIKQYAKDRAEEDAKAALLKQNEQKIKTTITTVPFKPVRFVFPLIRAPSRPNALFDLNAHVALACVLLFLTSTVHVLV